MACEPFDASCEDCSRERPSPKLRFGDLTGICLCWRITTVESPSTCSVRTADDLGQRGKCFDIIIGSAGQTLLALPIPIAPDHRHSERRCGVGVPRIRGLKRNLRGQDTQPVDHCMASQALLNKQRQADAAWIVARNAGSTLSSGQRAVGEGWLASRPIGRAIARYGPSSLRSKRCRTDLR
jgi:hypothetical protein